MAAVGDICQSPATGPAGKHVLGCLHHYFHTPQKKTPKSMTSLRNSSMQTKHTLVPEPLTHMMTPALPPPILSWPQGAVEQSQTAVRVISAGSRSWGFAVEGENQWPTLL